MTLSDMPALFTTASIDIANDQAALTADQLDELREELDRALEAAANEVLTRLNIAQTMVPTIITGDFYQAGDDGPDTP